MAEKTNLTKTGVKESPEIVSDPNLSGKTGLEETKDEKGVSWENRAKEFQSKYSTVAEKLDSANERLNELEEKVRLTEAEKAEKVKLDNRVNGLEGELRTFETDDQFRAAREYIKRNADTVKGEASNDALKQFYAEQVTDLVEEEAAKRNISDKELRAELLKYVTVQMMEMNPLKRTKETLKEYDNSIAFKKLEKKVSDKEAALNEFTESGERIPRKTTVEEAKKSGDLKGEMAALGI